MYFSGRISGTCMSRTFSAMPGDLEKQVTVDQMADLLEYLKAAKIGLGR